MTCAAKEADILPEPAPGQRATSLWSFCNILLTHATQRGTLLDVGCGTAEKLRALAPHFDCVVAIDPDPTMRACARETARRHRLRNIKVSAGRWQALPMRDGSVDAVTSMFSGVHAAEAHRVLKTGGILLFECLGPPNATGTPWPDPQSASMEFAATLYKALRDHFDHVSLQHAPWPANGETFDLTGGGFSAATAHAVTPTTLGWAGPRRTRFIALCRK